MITIKERKKLRKVLGSHYTSDVLAGLVSKNFFTKYGKEYSTGFISNVFNGKKQSEKVEEVIYDVYSKKLELHQKIGVQRKNILNKKPEVATSGLE